jgi:hypothetical protein
MSGPVGPVRSDSDRFGLGKVVRPIRFVCKDNRTGPIPPDQRTEDASREACPANAPWNAPLMPALNHCAVSALRLT